MNRLFVNALKSVGLVSSGDDPEATITFWKSKDFDKHSLPGSLDERVDRVRRAYWDQFGEDGPGGPHVSAVFASFVIVEDGDETFRVPYVSNDDEVSFGTPEEVELATTIIEKIRGSMEMLSDESEEAKMIAKAESLKDKPGARMDLSAIESEDLRTEIQKALDAKDAENETLQSQVDDLTAKVEQLDPPDPAADAPDEVKAILKAQQEKTEELEKKLAEERSTRRTAEYISKAKPLAPLMGKAEDVGPVLADLADKAPESFEKLEGWLTAAVQRSDLAKLFSQIGHEGEGESDPIAKRDAYVTKYLEDNPDKSPEEARAAFWKANPEAKEELRS